MCSFIQKTLIAGDCWEPRAESEKAPAFKELMVETKA